MLTLRDIKLIWGAHGDIIFRHRFDVAFWRRFGTILASVLGVWGLIWEALGIIFGGLGAHFGGLGLKNTIFTKHNENQHKIYDF